MDWLIGRKSNLSVHNKLIVYKQILKPVWSYGIQIWRCAKNDVIKIIQRFQNKILRTILNAPWYVRNSDIHRDLNMNTVTEEIIMKAEQHRRKLILHPNEEIASLLRTTNVVRRLNRCQPHDLIRRFNQHNVL
ncbi:putative RNA-directed DNA polymerase from transposon X-element [Lucilia cuprina]|nr:putative RNA-directed DNA polymerase from transposon X-element [Lucilia cuprina]